MRRFVAALTAIGMLSMPHPARADEPTRDPTRAEALFREARRLETEGKTAEACGLYRESQRLDPTLGTLLNLALCEEKQGRTATAWTLFAQAAAEASKTGQEARATFAKERAQALEPKLARLRVVVPPESASTEVRVNGSKLDAPAWGIALPYDPGPVRIELSAEGHTPRKLTLNVEPARTESFVVPVLERTPAPSPVTPATAPRPAPQAPPDRGAPTGTGDWTRTVGVIALGVGAAGVGVGSVLGIMAVGKKGDVDRLCDEAGRCQPGGAAAADDARGLALGATLGFAIGLTALAGGGALLLFGRRDASKASATVTLGPRGGVLVGTF